jgi:heptaprenyl diphosphate synthase
MESSRLARNNTKRLVILALFAASALIAGFLESHFPLPFPGMRLGIANIFSLSALLMFGPADAVTISALRLAISLFLTGNLVAFLCSAGGLLLSLPVSIALYKFFPESLGVPAISTAAAFAFNFGQLAAIALTVRTPEVFAYLPPLLLCAAPTGYAVGVLARDLSKRFKETLIK